MGRRSVSLASLLCLALLAGGCDSSEPEPKFSPTPTTSAPSTTTPPTTNPPVTPTVDPVVDSPRGVVRRWIRLYNELLTDGDGGEIRKLSTTCPPCLAIIRDIEGIYSGGGFFEGGAYSIQQMRSVGRNAGVVGIKTSLRAEPTRYRRGPDGPIRRFGGGPSVLEFDTRRDEGHWTIDYLVQVDA